MPIDGVAGGFVGAVGSISGTVGKLLAKLRHVRPRQARLELLERISLGQRQWLTLVEAEGRRILVATSAEGGPAFYPLNEGTQAVAGARPRVSRVSW